MEVSAAVEAAAALDAAVSGKNQKECVLRSIWQEKWANTVCLFWAKNCSLIKLNRAGAI